MPGDPWNPTAEGANSLLRNRSARLCLDVEDVLRVVGLMARKEDGVEKPLPSAEAVSEQARQVLEALDRAPRSFEEVKGSCGLASGAVTSALCELELLGWVIQRPGKIYEKV
jgi:DNA processing protein